MFRKAFKTLGLSLVALAIVGGVLYQFFGLRVVLDGGGMPRLRFVESADAQAERIRQHREAQRAQFAAEAPPGASTEPPADGLVKDESPGVAAGRTEPATAVVPGTPAPGASSYWSDFRGPLRDGIYREQPVLTAWPPSGLKPLWKQPAGGGYASFVIAQGRAYTIEQRGPDEVAAAYDVATGRELWTSAWRADFRESMGGDGPRATPTWADGSLYVLGAEGELRALDAASGRLTWRTNILEENGTGNLQWGMSAAPLVVGDLVIVQPGAYDGRSVVAYDRRTGKRAWSALDDHTSYASPMLATLLGVPQILVFSASRLVAISPRDGAQLWEFPWPGPNRINAAQPLVIGNDRIFISSGYGTGAAVVEISKAASGFSVREVWRNVRMKNRFASSVLHEGYIYGLDESILACIDAATGELAWKGGRYGYGQLLLASGHLIVLTEDGDLALVRATPDRHDELVRFPVLSGKTWNVPAIGGGYLLVRNLAEMAAFDLRVKGVGSHLKRTLGKEEVQSSPSVLFK
jgi:outer membrane protein assembly factor BamB